MNKYIRSQKEKGQTFLIVLMIMILALAAGITMSSRFIKNLRNISASDDSTKALAVAEAEIERLLLVPSDTLSEYINNSSCGSNCSLTITDVTGQTLTATATLSFVGNSTDSYPATVEEDETTEVFLTGYQSGRSLNVCWNGDTSISGYYTYSDGGVISALPFAYNAVLTAYNDNGFSSSAASFGYENCFTVTASDTPLGLRLRSLYGRSDVNVLPQAGFSIPVQGITIVSIGKAGAATRKVTVIKSNSYATSYFDYPLYQKTWDSALSN